MVIIFAVITHFRGSNFIVTFLAISITMDDYAEVEILTDIDHIRIIAVGMATWLSSLILEMV